MGSSKLLKRFPRLHAAYRGYRESKHLFRPPVKNPHGFWFTGNKLMQSGQFEPEETMIVQQTLGEVDVLINIGANIGYYCCMAIERKKRVIAFEPLPKNLEILMQNITLNGMEDSIEIFPLALGSISGIAKFFGGGTGASLIEGWAGQSAEQVILVPVSTLDIVLGNRMDATRCLVLIDVEGSELALLQSASKMLLNSPRPIWIVEISINEHQPDGTLINPNLVATFEIFFKAGYHAYVANGESRRILLNEVQQVAETGRDTLQTHNFVFRFAED
ncbi:MAG TPA: FkbM family methyltransferase [Pirellula sp.]|nr:FkbM family methyltransferase [Pirellula sp.]